MASLTMTASLQGCSASIITKHPSPAGGRRGVVAMAKASNDGPETANRHIKSNRMDEEGRGGRRELVFAAAAAAAAVSSVAKVAMANEPVRGSFEAKKKYAPVCVTMPTARICHK
ncbi:photosystem II 5 kDa protein, chloroplastic [Malania oleifera]|uniref:photosystem II 5 kDa protein, chloroplastic n=1 Tax=Malania oleifera TaxID=397392 RepID=UPI0025AE0FD8|nr:photosystem II 5 kDa protein, chloroplastic [Malania oleifera]